MNTPLESEFAELSRVVHRPREQANERAALRVQVQFVPEHLVEKERAPVRRPATAVLVVHGMGQQLPFETLDALANGLYREDVRSYGEAGVHAARVSHVHFGEERLERVEMQLRTGTDTTKEVHLYEAYWAPLTEGVVNLRDVISFLISAALNGVKNTLGHFCRWSFGAMRQYSIPVQALLYLLIGLFVVASLALVLAAISAMVAANALFTSTPGWLTPRLFADYSTVLSVVVGILELLTLSIVVGLLLSWARRRLSLLLWPPLIQGLMLLVALVSVLLFAASVITLVDAAAAVLALYRADAQLPPRSIRDFAAAVQLWQLRVACAAVLAAGFYFLWTLARSLLSQLTSAKAIVAFVFFALLVVSVCLLVARLSRSFIRWGDLETWQVSLMWGVLLTLSFVARRFLVQYVGDVVAYVQPQTLDRFAKVRTEIKDRVLKIAEAIYAQKSDGKRFDYERVVLVGHSLGSVIIYDTLNRLLLDDESINAPGRPWRIASRSSHLLTFGSPLNKIAFVFATQRKKRAMTLVRERLAALVQPLIESEVVRAGIRWVNIYSPWDIISGRLDFYDPPPGSKAFPVMEERDREAVTFLAAHTEYWRNTAVFAWLHAMT